MSYGYSPTTHTPWGTPRQNDMVRREAAPQIDRQTAEIRRLWRVLHGYTAATHGQRRAACDQLKALGVEV